MLERGKHDELLSNEHGAYTRLVTAQRLREADDVIDMNDAHIVGQSSGKTIEDLADIEEAALKETPLGRSSTQRSLASAILEQRKAQGSAKREERGLFYLFRRMGNINKGEWKKYLFGCFFAISEYSHSLNDCSLIVFSYWIRLPGFRYCLGYARRNSTSTRVSELTVSCLT